MKKRERLEVINDILKIIVKNHNSIKPTPLMRKANLSSSRFQDYLSELSEKRFIKEIENGSGKKFITLSDKGFKYIERYNSIIKFIEDFDL